jgi:hypothetical protein
MLSNERLKYNNQVALEQLNYMFNCVQPPQV